MAKILGNYGAARESAYFKVEQEAELQNHQKKLIKEGKLKEEDLKRAHESSLNDSEHVFEVLPEVLQQGARVDVPDAARRKEFERRVKGEPPQLSEAELRKYRSSLHMMGASLAHVPRISLSGRRYTMEGLGLQQGELVPGARALSPQAVEVASRTYMAGVRALVYGSLLGVLGIAAAGTYAVQVLDIRSGEDLRQRIQAGFGPMSHALQSWITPIRLRAQEWAGQATAAAAAPDSRQSEFQRRLTDRYNPRKGSEAEAAVRPE